MEFVFSRYFLLIGILVMLVMAIIVFIATKRNNFANRINSKEIEKYYSSQQECQQKTYTHCKCMLTNINTEMCTGWTAGI